MGIDSRAETLYFAYGSNMSTRRLRARNRVPRAEPHGRAILRNFGLRWHKSGEDKSGKCDIVPSPGECVHGVLFRIPKMSWRDLDRAEGVGAGYERCEATVELQGRPMTVCTYRATKIDPDLLPYDCYKAHVLRGAREHGLPEGYVLALESVESRPCPPRHSCDGLGKRAKPEPTG